MPYHFGVGAITSLNKVNITELSNSSTIELEVMTMISLTIIGEWTTITIPKDIAFLVTVVLNLIMLEGWTP